MPSHALSRLEDNSHKQREIATSARDPLNVRVNVRTTDAATAATSLSRTHSSLGRTSTPRSRVAFLPPMRNAEKTRTAGRIFGLAFYVAHKKQQTRNCVYDLVYI